MPGAATSQPRWRLVFSSCPSPYTRSPAPASKEYCTARNPPGVAEGEKVGRGIVTSLTPSLIRRKATDSVDSTASKLPDCSVAFAALLLPKRLSSTRPSGHTRSEPSRRAATGKPSFGIASGATRTRMLLSQKLSTRTTRTGAHVAARRQQHARATAAKIIVSMCAVAKRAAAIQTIGKKEKVTVGRNAFNVQFECCGPKTTSRSTEAVLAPGDLWSTLLFRAGAQPSPRKRGESKMGRAGLPHG